MGSGCGDSIVDKILRPPGKLPVPVALNAPSPTLFTNYYTRFYRNCKYLFFRGCNLSSNGRDGGIFKETVAQFLEFPRRFR